MADKNSFSENVGALFEGMDSIIATKTVVGEAIHVGDTIILPLSDVSFGIGVGALSGNSKDNGAGGMTGKIQASAVLIIQNGHTKMIPVKGPEGIAKIIDMVPDMVDRFSDFMGSKSDSDAEIVEEELNEE